MYEGIRCFQLDTGTTVFLSLKPAAMKEMRRAVRNAMSSGDEPQPFVVRACVEYYGGRIEQVISQPSLIEYVQSCTGSTGNAIHCLLLWDLYEKNGLLLHETDGAYSYSWVPLISREQAMKEQHISQLLRTIAGTSGDIQTYLSSPIPAGSHSLQPLLEQMAEEI